MNAPALPLCLAFIAGIGSSAVAELAPTIGFATASLALLGSLVCVRLRVNLVGTGLVVVAFAFLGNAAGTVRIHQTRSSPLAATFERWGEREFATPRLVTGSLRREPDARADATILNLDVESMELRGQVSDSRGGLRVSVRGERRATLRAFSAGDRVRLWAMLSRPSSFHNPGGFDTARYLERQRIDLVASVKSALLVERVTVASVTPVALVSRFRRFVQERLRVSLPAIETRGVVTALVTGDRSELSPSLTRVYQRAGIFHVMAISGAHVAIWIGFLYTLLRWMGVSTRTTLVILSLLLPGYAAFCGARPPVVRAVLMAVVVIGARFHSLSVPPSNVLSLAAIVLLAWEPLSLYDAGFQLTMAAMATIVVFYPHIVERLAPLGVLAQPLAVSLAAQIGVLPIAAWHFHRLTLAAPVASLAAIPIAAVICVLGVALVAVSGIPLVSSLIVLALSGAVGALNGVAELAASVPGGSVRVGAPSWMFVGAYVMALGLVLAESRRARASGFALAAVLCGLALFPLRASDDVLEINVLDVGHGDAIVVTLPEGGSLLVDGGGLPVSSFDVGERVVLPFLLDRGVRRLDAVVVTHADYDHIGGLRTVVDELRVDELWRGAVETNRWAYRELVEVAVRHRVSQRVLAAREQFELEGVSFEVLAAGGGVTETSNDRSLVLRVGFGGRHVLLTGDAESSLEQKLVRSGIELRADVLKLAHHGSRTSTTSAFLDEVRPTFAIVSARRTRSRPIPSDEVLERLRERGIDYARTDENGTVTVRIHRNGQIEVKTFR